MNTLAAGDNTVRIPGLGRRDEIGAMARSIAVFKQTAHEVERIRAQEQAAKETAERDRRETLKHMADSFENTVRKVALAVHESAERIATDAQGLSRDSATTRSQGEDMVRTIAHAANSMTRVVQSSDDQLRTVETVSRHLTESGASIRRALDGANAITARVQALSHAAQDIGQVVSLIAEIEALAHNLTNAVRLQTAASADIRNHVDNAAEGTDAVSDRLGHMSRAIVTAAASADGMVAAVADLTV